MLYFSIQNRFQDRTSKVSEAAGARWRFYRRIMVGLSSNPLYIGGSKSESFRCNLELEDFVAGAVFAEVGGWHCLLCALEMTLHMRRTSIMRFILRSRRNIWWSWIVTFRGRRSIWWHFRRYSSLLFAILPYSSRLCSTSTSTLLFSYESILRRIYSLTLRISFVYRKFLI